MMTDQELIRDAREMAGAMPSNHGVARLLRMLAIRLSNANDSPAAPPAEPGSAEITVTCETPDNWAANEMAGCEWCCEPWGGGVNTDYPDEPRAACSLCGTLFLPIPELIHATGGA